MILCVVIEVDMCKVHETTYDDERNDITKIGSIHMSVRAKPQFDSRTLLGSSVKTCLTCIPKTDYMV